MDGDVFADDVVVTDDDAGRTAGKADVLRQITDDTAGVETVSRAEFGPAGQIDVRTDLAFFADCHLRIDDGIGADRRCRGNAGTRMNDSGRMNHTKNSERKGENRAETKHYLGFKERRARG